MSDWKNIQRSLWKLTKYSNKILKGVIFTLTFCLLTYCTHIGYSQQLITTYYTPEKANIKEVFYANISNQDTTKHGGYKIYYKSGVIWQQTRYNNGQLDSILTDNYENGSLRQRMFFKNGKLEGRLEAV